jgi:hypothetical protein
VFFFLLRDVAIVSNFIGVCISINDHKTSVPLKDDTKNCSLSHIIYHTVIHHTAVPGIVSRILVSYLVRTCCKIVQESTSPNSPEDEGNITAPGRCRRRPMAFVPTASALTHQLRNISRLETPSRNDQKPQTASSPNAHTHFSSPIGTIYFMIGAN